MFQHEQNDDNESNNNNMHSSGIKEQSCEEDARCMNLYSRLFHRKGPWFNLSDIFMRYYYRDYIRRESYYQKYEHENENENSQHGHNDHDNVHDDGEHADATIKQVNDNDDRNLSDNDNGNDDGNLSDNGNPQKKIITWDWIESCLIDCFNDIHYLLSNGFIRNFINEEECGIIVGNVDSFCTIKEKDSVCTYNIK